MTDVLELMCRSSPVQKEWKRRCGDKCIEVTSYGPQTTFITTWSLKDRNTCAHPEEIVWDDEHSGWCRRGSDAGGGGHRYWWILRQEDWQEIHSKIDPRNGICDLNAWTDRHVDYYHDMVENTEPQSNSKYWTILWCLVVHREVYGLEWDWKENKWVKI